MWHLFPQIERYKNLLVAAFVALTVLVFGGARIQFCVASAFVSHDLDPIALTLRTLNLVFVICLAAATFAFEHSQNQPEKPNAARVYVLLSALLIALTSFALDYVRTAHGNLSAARSAQDAQFSRVAPDAVHAIRIFITNAAGKPIFGTLPMKGDASGLDTAAQQVAVLRDSLCGRDVELTYPDDTFLCAMPDEAIRPSLGLADMLNNLGEVSRGTSLNVEVGFDRLKLTLESLESVKLAQFTPPFSAWGLAILDAERQPRKDITRWLTSAVGKAPHYGLRFATTPWYGARQKFLEPIPLTVRDFYPQRLTLRFCNPAWEESSHADFGILEKSFQRGIRFRISLSRDEGMSSPTFEFHFRRTALPADPVSPGCYRLEFEQPST